ncbi:hypothetical protein [Streptomyces sp. NPDC088261]|uniref:hypothetical protein n=1 Tax=Streptomyces sp. NPDC088261 TaxID=3365851 RepID=UPI003818F596
MADDGRGADVITLPMLNLAPPGSADDDGVPPPPTPGDLAPPPDFFLPFSTPGDGDDSSTVDPDDVAPEMVANASSGTGTPARATAAMAMVTMAAIAVAALRGTWSMANYLKARREHHDAVADKAREAADKQKVANAAAGAKKGVQSGPEFGRGATGKGGGGRSGGSGASGGGSGRGTFGQQQKPSPKSGGRGSTANGSTGAGGRGSGSGTGPKGPKNGTAGSGSRTSGSGSGSRTSGPGSSGKGSKGAAGGGTGSSGSGSGSSKGSPSGAKKSPGTLGKLVTGRQQRKNDDAKAQRQAAADQRKADLADRAAARKEAAAEAADRRKRRAEKRKAKREREKADGTGPKDQKETSKGKPDEKVDLTKKPKAGDGTGAKGDTEKVDLTKKPKPGSSKGGAKKKPKAPRKKKPRSWRRKPKGSTGPKTRRRRRTDRSTSGPGAMPGGDGEWLRPPPGWDVTYKVDLEVIRPEPRRRQPAGITTGRRELPAGSSGQVTPTRSVPKVSPIVMGTAIAVGEVGDTQFVDADLTVYDLIESDEEMGEQILQGVDHMNLVASKCEGLKSGLESLYSMCIEKQVPGVLVEWCIRLMERAGSVQDKAEALRDSLPRASEAILSARDTAVEADKLRADRVKEAGHVAPAEREYHDRSGA